MTQARAEVATCAISGVVGTFANVDPRVEAYVADKMGLKPEPISTQVIPRDRHAMYFATLAVIASSLERLATEIRHLQRTEVLEAEEYFSEGQKGSSAMPHKRNPVLSENITGLARMVRSYALPAMENVALWHERDISHSSVERMIGPDATVTLDFALNRMTGLIDKLVVYPENMKKNLDRLGGLVHSQRVMIALTQKGIAREDAYRLVQRNAMAVWQGKGDFLALLKADADVAKALRPSELEPLFDLAYHLKHVDTIFTRVFGGRERHAPSPFRRHALRAGCLAGAIVVIGRLVRGFLYTRGPPIVLTLPDVHLLPGGGERQPITRRCAAMMTTMMAPMAAMTIWSSHSLPRLIFQPAAWKTKPPTKAPMSPVIR